MLLKAQIDALKQERQGLNQQIKEIKTSEMDRHQKKLAIASVNYTRRVIREAIQDLHSQREELQATLNNLKEELKLHPAQPVLKDLKALRQFLKESMWDLATIVELHCASDQFKPSSCAMDGKILKFELINNVSNTICVKKENYGRKSRSVWVDHGCRADFKVWVY